MHKRLPQTFARDSIWKSFCCMDSIIRAQKRVVNAKPKKARLTGKGEDRAESA